jgi:hypothetical protein
MSNVIKAEPQVHSFEVVISRWESKENTWYSTKKIVVATCGNEARDMVIKYFIKNRIMGVIESFPVQLGH